MLGATAVLLAALLDTLAGEPRDAWHPVAWFGRLMAPLGRRLRTGRPAAALAGGALAWTTAIGGCAALAAALEHAIVSLPAWAAVPLLALALKPAFAWRMLRDEVQAVGTALESGLDAGRARLARLCSRDVRTLDATTVRETAIETLAENFNDSLVAPLFWFAVAGLPGAWAWRAANTLDAMWGYRGAWEWAGKWAARADDFGGWLPARLAAALLAWPAAWRRPVPLRVLAAEAARTPSPNGGWPMAAMALRLGVRLHKPGVYVLNAEGRPADAAALARALVIAGAAARAVFVLAAGAVAVKAAWR